MSERDSYRALLRRARRLSRDAAEAEDLLHDALVAALAARREPLAVAADARWLGGVLKRLAAMRIRTVTRRRAREAAAAPPAAWDDAPLAVPVADLLTPMPPAARRVAVLVLHGLNAREICWIHNLSDTAFRQRLTTIRRALKRWPDSVRAEALAAALHRPGRPDLDYGLMRRALLTVLGVRPGLGSHDPDGHLLVLTAAPPAATDGQEDQA